MNNQEIQLMKEAAGEIKNLRQRLQYANGRLQMFDDVMLLLRTAPGYGNSPGMGEDIAWKLDQAVAKAEEENK